jgi:hypothetical protein
MPARLLICARDMRGEGPGQWLKGEFVEVRSVDMPWGNLEALPDFLRVEVSNANPGDFGLARDEWRQNFEWDQIASDLTVDGHRYQIWTTNRSASGLGDISLSQVQNFLERWGATNIIAQARGVAAGVRFDLLIHAAATSQGFWDLDVAPFTFSELAYVQADGTHDIRVVYPAGIDHDVALREVGELATVIADDPAAQQIDYRLTRVQVLAKLKLEIKAKMQNLIRRRQLYLDAAAVDQAIGQGGSVTVTAAQLQNNMHDRIAE